MSQLYIVFSYFFSEVLSALRSISSRNSLRIHGCVSLSKVSGNANLFSRLIVSSKWLSKLRLTAEHLSRRGTKRRFCGSIPAELIIGRYGLLVGGEKSGLRADLLFNFQQLKVGLGCTSLVSHSKLPNWRSLENLTVAVILF